MLHDVTSALEKGHVRIVVEASPGAGKTHLILQLSSFASTLVLAYNSLLAANISRELCPDHSVCMTYHALCGRYIALARDDFDLDQIVSEVESGERAVTSYPTFHQVFIDEAQDVRPLYIRLLRVLNLLTSSTRIFVAGDRKQLVYDFDEDFPASLDVLCKPPEAVHPGVWVRVTSNYTQRLTGPMCALVNAVFGSSIYTDKSGPPIEIRCPRSAFSLHRVLSDISDPYLLLFDRRRNNAPLRELINRICETRNVKVHGVDDDGDSVGDVCAATFWSSKGIQADTVVVLLPGSAAPNPTYVALTRGVRRLIVVLDPRDPHAAMCNYASNASRENLVIVGATAQQCVALGAQIDASSSLKARPRVAKRDVVCLDTTSIRTSIVRTATTCVSPDATMQKGDAGSVVVMAMALVWMEITHVRRCRSIDGILQPCRMNAEMRDTAILHGFVGRNVSPFTLNVLSSDLVERVRAAYETLGGDHLDAGMWNDLFTVACATLTWDAFEHILRQSSLPSRGAHAATVQWVRETVRSDSIFDTRLVKQHCQVHYHVRVHASCDECCYHVVWEFSSSEYGGVAIRALLHPSHRCRVLCMGSMTTTDVTISDPDVLWKALH